MTQISLRVDENVKKQAETVCAEIGMSLSTAINIYLVRLGKERRVPFDVSADTPYSDPFFLKENFDVLRSRARDAESGRNMASHNLIED